jgi:hypothetical protein
LLATTILTITGVMIQMDAAAAAAAAEFPFGGHELLQCGY